MKRLIFVVFLAAAAVFAGPATASADAAHASVTQFQIPAMGFDDCPSGCIPMEHNVIVTIGERPGQLVLESDRGRGRVDWRNLDTGATGSVELSWTGTDRRHIARTGPGWIVATLTVTPGMWPGVGAFHLPVVDP